MEASSDMSLEDNYVQINKDNVLKCAVILGANASGKTNLLRSLLLSKRIIESSLTCLTDNLPIYPFQFDESGITEPTEFQIKFIKDGIKYAYGFSANKDRIINEYLFYSPNGRSAKIFERKNTTEYEFGSDSKLLFDLKTMTNEKMLFLQSAAIWNYEKVKPVYEFLTKEIISLINERENSSLKPYFDNEELKEFALWFFKKADISIFDFEVKKIKIGRSSINSYASWQEENNEYYHIIVKYKVGNREFQMPLEHESSGIRKIFAMLPLLKDSLDFGKVLLIDELDSSMHPLLIKLILSMYNDKKINKKNAQLIFTTNITNLLDLSLLRRDQIWLIDMDCKTRSSSILQLDKFSPRKTDNIEKNYLSGKYGSIPNIEYFKEIKHEKKNAI